MTEHADQQAAIVERARRDPDFRARLLADPRGAIAAALGVELPAGLDIRVIEERPGEAVLVLPAATAPGSVSESELAGVAGGSGGTWCGHTNCSVKCGCPSVTCERGCPH